VPVAKGQRVSTKPAQKLPCRRVADLCTCSSVNRMTECWCHLIELPAGDLEGGAKDLGPYKLRHLDTMAEANSSRSVDERIGSV